MKDTTQNADAGKRCPPWGKVAVAAARDDRLSAAHYRLLIVLAAHAKWPDNDRDAPGLAFPFLSTIKDLHGISKGTVSDYARQLEAWGYIKIERVPSPYGGRPRQRYAVFAVGVEVPPQSDIALVGTRRKRQREGRKFRDSRTSQTSELRTSEFSELGTSETLELASSDRPNFNREQTYETDVSGPRYDNSHSRAPAAASQTGGVPIESLADADGRVRLRAGMPAPDFVLREHRYRVGLGKTAWMSAPRELREATWRRFLAAKTGKDWAPITVSGEFSKWVREQMGHRRDGTPSNPDPLWREFDKLQTPSAAWQPKASLPTAPPSRPTLLVVANMAAPDWAADYTHNLETKHWRPQWGIWTCDHHDERMTLVEAQKSWSRFCWRALEFLIAQGKYNYRKPAQASA